MARPSNTEERRAQIIEGLREVMAADGYERASVNRIARAAGLSPGLVHYHFESKQDILLRLVEGLTVTARQRIEDRLGRVGASPRQRVHGFLDALLGRGADASPEATACWAIIGAEAIRQPEVRVLWEAWIVEARDALEALLRDACRAESRSGQGLLAMAAGLVATIEGYYGVAAASSTTIPRGSASRVACRMADGLLDAQPHQGEPPA
jgi:TetR/AcrR family transcriptional repressor of bet genes